MYVGLAFGPDEGVCLTEFVPRMRGVSPNPRMSNEITLHILFFFLILRGLASCGNKTRTSPSLQNKKGCRYDRINTSYLSELRGPCS